jgi:hypothetical protein
MNWPEAHAQRYGGAISEPQPGLRPLSDDPAGAARLLSAAIRSPCSSRSRSSNSTTPILPNPLSLIREHGVKCSQRLLACQEGLDRLRLIGKC